MLRYELDRLGWFEFEHLIQALLKSKLGLGVEAWGGTRGDLGRDAYFQGTLRYPGNVPTAGRFIFQCKFVENANAAGAQPGGLILASVRKECLAISKRLFQRTCDHYSFFTNATCGKNVKVEIQDLLSKAIPSAGIHIHDGPDICAWLDNAPKVVRSFPQVLGLRDLATLIGLWANPEILKRSEAAIALAKDVAKVFVPTATFHKALKVVSRHHFVILEGPPEMGKTAIGRMIALRGAAQKWEALECRRPGDVLTSHRPEAKQIFVADDFFGRTEYEPGRVSAWQEELPHVLRILDSSHLLVLTTRAHLLNIAKGTLDIAGQNKRFPELGEVIVNAAALTVGEKARILYRHAKAANLSRVAVGHVRMTAKSIVYNHNFTPERIRKLTFEVLPTMDDALLTEDKVREKISQTLSDPTKGMRSSFRNLSESHKWLMFALLEMESATKDFDNELSKRYAKLCPSDHQEPFARVKTELTEAFVKVDSHGDGTSSLRWIHPSCRDLAIEELGGSPRYRKRFLGGCSTQGLFLALSIGGGEKGARIFPFLGDEDDWAVVRERLRVAFDAGGNPLETLVAYFRVAKEQKVPPDQLEKLRQLIGVFVPLHYEQSRQEGWSVQAVDTFYKGLAISPGVVNEPDFSDLVTTHVDSLCDYLKYLELWDAAPKVEEFRDLVLTLEHPSSTQFSREKVDLAVRRGYAAISEAIARDLDRELDMSANSSRFRTVASGYEDVQGYLQELSWTQAAANSDVSEFSSAAEQLAERASVLRDALSEQEEELESEDDRKSATQEVDIDELFSDL